MTPIVFIHNGYSDYLEFTLRQAVDSYPDSEVVLLGERNDRFDFVEHVDAAKYTSGADSFDDHYKHFSANRYSFELSCFRRWFILAEVMQDRGWDSVVVCDSDVLIYPGLVELVSARAAKSSVALMIPQHQPEFRWVASPHVAFWTAGSLQSFCTFCTDLYTEEHLLDKLKSKWRHDQAQGAGSGVCDMTALYLFTREQTDTPAVNLMDVADATSVDLNINSSENCYPDEFEMRGGTKAINVREGVPTCRSILTNSEVRLLALHFQGKAKYLMHRYYQGPAFAGMRTTSIRRQLFAILASTPVAHLLRSLRRRREASQ